MGALAPHRLRQAQGRGMKQQKREPAYVKHRREMLESPARRGLTMAAVRVLERLEIELMRHAGKNNGALIVTYAQFAEHGIRYPSIAPAIRLLVELGFLQVTQHGWRSAGQHRPARYRLTYLSSYGNPPTDEWKITSRYENVTAAGYENVSGTGYENVSGNGSSVPKNRVRKRNSFIHATHTPPRAGRKQRPQRTH